jgi:biopolymer transport protein ExbB/TolQ
MDQHKQPDIEEIKKRFQLGADLEQAIENEDISGKSPILSWQKLLIDLLLLLSYFFFLALALLQNFDFVDFIAGNTWSLVFFRLFLVLVITIVSLKIRSTLWDFLFPKIDREVVKTIYKISPDLIRDEIMPDSEEIETRKVALTNYMFLFGFITGIFIFILTNPAFADSALDLLQDNTVASQIVRLIVGAFLVGAYLSISNLMKIHAEYQSLKQVVWKLRNIGTGIGTYRDIQHILPDKKNSMVSKKIKSIWRIYHIKGSVDPMDLAAQKTSGASMSFILPYYIASIMPILGLIGTVLGLTISIGGFEDVLAAETVTDKVQFATTLGQSIEGIGTAFYTTLAGTVCMLIMKFFNLLTGNTYQNFMTDMHNTLSIEIIPRLNKTKKTNE